MHDTNVADTVRQTLDRIPGLPISMLPRARLEVAASLAAAGAHLTVDKSSLFGACRPCPHTMYAVKMTDRRFSLLLPAGNVYGLPLSSA